MNVNSNTTNKASTNAGLSGLASGVDTEAMVEAMLSGMQSKIDKQNQLLKQTEWKQELYRNVIDQINSFQSKYFNLLSPSTNIMSSSFFSATTSTTASKAFTAVANGSNFAANTKVDVAQLAKAALIKSNSTASKDIEGTFDISKIPAGETVKLSVELNGVKKEISLTADGGDLAAQMQTGLDKAFGKNAIKVEATGNNFKLTTPNKGNEITVSGDEKALKAIGLTKQASNFIDIKSSLKNTAFGTKIQGETYKFTINGVEISGSTNESVREMMNKVNKSGAGVNLSYDSLTDKFSMTNKETGKGFGIEMSQQEGNVLSAMFGVENSASATSGKLVTDSISGSGYTANDKFTTGSFEIFVNGVKHTITIPKKELAEGETEPKPYTKDEIYENLNKQLKDKFGDGAITVSDTGVLVNKEGMSVSFADKKYADAAAFDKAVEDGNLNAMLGLHAEKSNAVTSTTDVNTIVGLKGKGFSGTIGDIAAATGSAAINADGTVTVTGNSNLSRAIFGTDLAFGSGGDSGLGYTKTEGTNAVVVIDGVIAERSSNTFDMSGFTFSLTDVTDKNLNVNYDADGKITSIDNLDKTTGTATIETKQNTDDIVKGVMDFVNDYNKLVKELNDLTGESKDYKKYPPLTDAQKKEMSDKEIEAWEEKSKKGLLAGDNNITSFLANMRKIMYQKPEGSEIAIYDLGIETGSWDKKGQLVVDEKKLRAAVEKDSEAVGKLFSGENGLAARLNEEIDRTAKKSSGSPGTLVSLAGAVGTGKDKDNTLTKKMKDINDKIASLKRSYEMQKTRYWSQFNKMETAMSNIGAQSGWLSQFGSM